MTLASQEFLASFAVDIDEADVSRLQSVLEENRDLADEVGIDPGEERKRSAGC